MEFLISKVIDTRVVEVVNIKAIISSLVVKAINTKELVCLTFFLVISLKSYPLPGLYLLEKFFFYFLVKPKIIDKLTKLITIVITITTTSFSSSFKTSSFKT